MKTGLNKIGFIIVCFFLVNNVYTQITYQEISVNKIKSITETSTIFLKENSTAIVDEKIMYFDDKGFDTLIVLNGKKYQTSTREYNDKNQLVFSEKKSHVNSDDIDSCTYEHKADGSFTEIQFSKKYTLSFLYKYDKKGRMVYLKIPNGSIKTYRYDKFNNKIPPNHLVSAYNIKGKLIRTYPKKNKSETTEYTYNIKGFIARIVQNYPKDYELNYKTSIKEFMYHY